MIVPCPRDFCRGWLLVDDDQRRYCACCGRYPDPLPPPRPINVDPVLQAENRRIFGDTQAQHRGRPRLADLAERAQELTP